MIKGTPLPSEFVQQIACFPGLALALDSEPSVAIRYNKHKSPCLPHTPVPWCEHGDMLDERPDFTFDPAMHQGLYYVQDASSMATFSAVADAVDTLGTKPLKVADMCAAPGGKTTAAIDALPEGSIVVANEYDYKRAEILAENVAKWGSTSVAVTRGDTSKLAKMRGEFDIVIVDAPCSGEGMMRKDEKARQQWSPALVTQCATLQREILANSWEALAAGGILIYSTCTFNRHENEDMLEWMMANFGAESISLPRLDAHSDIIAPGIDTKAHCYHFLPGKVRGEGLFIGALRKGACEQKSKSAKIKSHYSIASSVIASQVKKWINRPEEYEILTKDDTLYAVPKPHLQFLLALSAVTDSLTLGTPIATIKGRDLIPAHQWLLSNDINLAAFPTAEVNKDVAISYLQRQSVNVEAPKGIVILTYLGKPLGFVKNLGNRSNNLYPKNWRILRNS